MSLHPGEQGVCGVIGASGKAHGLYDEFCDKCADEKRTGTRRGDDRRGAVDQQTKPIGTGPVVLDTVKEFLVRAIEWHSFPSALPPLVDPANIRLLLADLEKRSEMGTKKYGTPLRAGNGRSALVDLYQEIQDAIMYAMQGKMDGDKQAGAYFEILYATGAQIAGELNKRG